MFKDTKEGTTHYFNDGCGEQAHNCSCGGQTERLKMCKMCFNIRFPKVEDTLKFDPGTDLRRGYVEGFEAGKLAQFESMRADLKGFLLNHLNKEPYVVVEFIHELAQESGIDLTKLSEFPSVREKRTIERLKKECLDAGCEGNEHKCV